MECNYPNCERTIENYKWGRIKAEGWFQKKNEDIWCPEHIPEWVEEWRKRKNSSERV